MARKSFDGVRRHIATESRRGAGKRWNASNCFSGQRADQIVRSIVHAGGTVPAIDSRGQADDLFWYCENNRCCCGCDDWPDRHVACRNHSCCGRDAGHDDQLRNRRAFDPRVEVAGEVPAPGRQIQGCHLRHPVEELHQRRAAHQRDGGRQARSRRHGGFSGIVERRGVPEGRPTQPLHQRALGQHQGQRQRHRGAGELSGAVDCRPGVAAEQMALSSIVSSPPPSPRPAPGGAVTNKHRGGEAGC